MNLAGVGNTLFYPITFVLYKLLVVLPNKLTYHILELINWITGNNMITMLAKNNQGQSAIGSVFSPQNQFFTVFMFVVLVGLALFVVAFIFGMLRAFSKKSANGEVNKKANMLDILKRSTGGIVIVMLIPIMFVLTTSLIGYFFNMLYGIGNFNPSNSSDYNAYGAMNNFINYHYNQDLTQTERDAWQLTNHQRMSALMVFNIWSSGYDMSGENLTIAQAIDKNGHDLNTIAHSIFNLMKGNSFSSIDGNIASVDRWNIFISILCSLVMLYLIIMFVVSVLSRLLEVYFLVLISPIVIFGGIAMDKTQGKWIVKTFHKIICVNVAILGYFFFNLIYMLMLSTILASNKSFSLTILKFALLFAGMVLVNQVPKIFMSFLNSDEQVVGNELKEAMSQTKTITAPLTTAMGSAFVGTLSLMRSNNTNMANNMPYTPVTSNNYKY